MDWLLAGLAEGSGRALVLEGEAGIGKSHLADVVRTRAAATGALVLDGGADEMEQDRPAASCSRSPIASRYHSARCSATSTSRRAACGASPPAPGASLTARLGGAAGNPLFIIELLRALDHDGALRVDGGVVETDAQALPASVQDAVVRRLSSMAAPTVEVLRLASLLGSEFVLADLATVAGQSVVSVAARLHEAVDAAVLTGEGDTLSFRHDLIREAI